MTVNITSLFGILLIATCSVSDEVDFNRDVRRILSNHCYVCHGPDESSRQADLRLDNFASATEYAIVPGDPAASEVFQRITDDDSRSRMPPSQHGPPLTDQQQEIIRRWIESGARYEVHWAYKKPVRPPLPEATVWTRNTIDRLVLQEMNKHGLAPSPPADRYAIIRRVALDLTGLPPTLQEVHEFIRDDSESAYEAMVDRFLAKPAYGERWAAVWLDQARYADSMGFAEDRPREIWAYRDYVIRSFNNNKPFDQFTVEQLAGDLLPDSTEEQLVATAFHRNTLTNTEGGTIDEEFRSAAVVDRTNTTLAVWMGTTIACAQCHDHKYDPISQKEYYQFYAFLNNTQDNDQPDDRPLWEIFSSDQQRKRSKIESEIESLNAELTNWRDLPESEKAHRLDRLQQDWERQFVDLDSYCPSGRIVRLQIPAENAILSLAEVQVFAGGRNIALQGKADQSSTAYDGPATLAIDDNTDGRFERSRSVTHTDQESQPWWEIDLGRSHPIDRIVVWNRTDGNLHSRSNGLVVSILNEKRQQVWNHKFDRATKIPQSVNPEFLPSEILAAIKNPNRSEQESKMLRSYFVGLHGPEILLKQEIEAARRKYKSTKPETRVPVLRELPENAGRETRVHHRGNYQDQRDLVVCGTPKVFHPVQTDTMDRLAMARWLVASENPLTARVTVNRLWQQLFGIGIVATSEDFGTQGEMPTHRELLDYLACEFMDSGWDIKSILKQIVMSATYRQTSSTTAAKLESDAGNRWLSRGPGFRLSAEMIRDQALFSSGLLNTKMFGPPVQPPQPSTGLKKAFRGDSTDWVASTDQDRYRRAIYTKWQRSNPYPSLSTFDISNREVCEVRRLRTNTPLQALVTLNDPVFVEAAQALARKVIDHPGDRKKKLVHAFRLVLIRPPKKSELTTLVELYDETIQHFEQDPESAKQLAVDPLNPVGDNANLIELATWTTIANVVLNLDEALMKR